MKTIVYIVSDVRSGSTLLENILSKSECIVSVGELHHLDSHIHKGTWGRTWNWTCSCGESFDSCAFWLMVYEKLGINEPSDISKTELIPKNDQASKRLNSQITKQLDSIYDAVFSVSRVEVIVDSSKRPFQGLEIYKNSSHRVKLIHLKRDLRAVAISKNKWNIKFSGKSTFLLKILFSSFMYRWRCNKFLKKARKADVYNLNYEDFSTRAQDCLNDISRFIGVDKMTMPEYMELVDDHTVGGSPNRFEKRKIQFDDKWQCTAKKNIAFNVIGFLLNKFA